MLPPFRLRPLLPPVRCSSTPLRSQSVPAFSSCSWSSYAPGFVVNSSPSAVTWLAPRIVLRTMLVATSWGKVTLADSLPPGRSGRCGLFSSADASPGIAIPSLPVRRRRARPSARRLFRRFVGAGPEPGRPVDLPGGIAERQRSGRLGESSLPAVI